MRGKQAYVLRVNASAHAVMNRSKCLAAVCSRRLRQGPTDAHPACLPAGWFAFRPFHPAAASQTLPTNPTPQPAPAQRQLVATAVCRRPNRRCLGRCAERLLRPAACHSSSSGSRGGTGGCVQAAAGRAARSIKQAQGERASEVACV